MNVTEEKAYKWLTDRGVDGLVFRQRGSPDFLASSGTGYEIKLLRNSTVTFYDSQVRELKQHGNTYIMVFNGGTEPVARFHFNDVTIPGFWGNIRLSLVIPYRKPEDTLETGYLTKQEAAKLLKVHPRTLMRWVNAGEVKAYRIGPLVRFSETDLQSYMEGQTIVTDEESNE
ncbi:hypothetical protein LCGC14_0902120 [marine sediment metagenome]|uniref:Helix-turn-helix domain-containing protein n=1 Tax=marine sediment metagenome TaxID=412755 RepID=A0A0F9RF59_9ZZZZ